MTLARFQSTAVDTSGNVIAGASVTVRSQSSGNVVSIFSDRAGTVSLANPFTTDANGFFAFHVAGGTYRITISDGSTNSEITFVGVGRVQENEVIQVSSAGDVGIGATPVDGKRLLVGQSDFPTSEIRSTATGAFSGAYFNLVSAGASSTFAGIRHIFTLGSTGASDLTDTTYAIQNINANNEYVSKVYNYSRKNDFHAWYTNDVERLRINIAGDVGIGANPSAIRLHVANTANEPVGLFDARSASLSREIYIANSARAASSAYDIFSAYASDFTNRTYQLRGDGEAFADGSWTGGGADYAEFFEWADGNLDEEDRRGLSVVLDAGKIRPATQDDAAAAILGVVSANPTVVGDAAWNHWVGRYLRDDYGSYVLEDYEVWEWTETITKPGVGPNAQETTEDKLHSYAFDGVPEGVVVPDDKTVTIQQRRKLNPDYDPDTEYVPREDRPEWSTIGLMGKLRLRKGQPTGDRWIKLRDISDAVEEWLVR